MTIFLYFILAIGFLVAVFFLFGLMADKKKNQKADTAQRDSPQDEQQFDPEQSAREKKGKEPRQEI